MNRGENNEAFRASESQHAPTLHAIEIAGALQSTLHTIADRDFSLDVQQEEALHQLGKALVSGKKTGYIEMATSTGKTTIESLVAEAGIKASKRVLMLAPTISIANQLSGRNREVTTGLKRFTNLHADTDIGHHYGNSRARYSDQLVITTYSGLLNEAKRGSTQLGDFDVVIADECHRSLGENTSEAMRTLFPDAFKFGFSATADYAIDRKSEEVFGEQLFEFSLIEAVEQGKTAPVRTLLYETDQNLELFDSRNDFTERELAPLINNPERNGTAYQLAVSLVKEGRQGIIACIPGEINIHARVMASLLNDQDGVTAAEIGAHLSDEQNALRITAFQSGAIKVLTFTRALEEGWDSDKASFCINMAPTSSPVRTKQLLGRTLRKKDSDIESIYIDFVDAKTGRDKSQYTAMHALDLETINVDRVLGRYQRTPQDNDSWHPLEKLSLPHLDRQLFERIMRSNGRLLSDVLVTQQPEKVDPLVRHWERVLAKEGMSAEPQENDVLPPIVQKAYHEVYKSLLKRDGGTEPTPEEVIEVVLETRKELSLFHKKALGEYGVKLVMDLKSLDALDIPVDSTAELSAMQSETRLALRSILNDLSEREAGVIVYRFGLGNDTPLLMNEIADRYGVQRERIRQIETKTLKKLRQPWRSKSLLGNPYDAHPVELEKTEAKEDEKQNLNVRNLGAYIDKITEQYEPITTDEASIDTLMNIAKNAISFDNFKFKLLPYTQSLAIPEYLYLSGKQTFDRFIASRKQFIGQELSYIESRIASLEELPVQGSEQKSQRIGRIGSLRMRSRMLDHYVKDLNQLSIAYSIFAYSFFRNTDDE